MARYFKKRQENKGLPPGSLIFIGTKKVDQSTIECLSYNKAELSPATMVPIEATLTPPDDHNIWYNVTGIDNVEFMAQFQSNFGIHPLFMEDIMNTGQRAKFEELEDTVFISIKMLQFNASKDRVIAEQVSFVLKEHQLISFQEAPGDTFDAVRERLKNPDSNLRRLGPGYLVYALIDSIVDNYIYLIETLGEQIDNLELEVIENPDEDTLQRINRYKQELHYVLKVIRPVRELMHNVLRSQTVLLNGKNVRPYLKDLSDLIIHAVESVEAYRVILTDYIQIYHSTMSTRMNDIMRILTIFSAIFIPLSFFAGVYGTNFVHFPELQYQYAYPTFWIVAVLIALFMLLFFQRKGWL